MKRVLQSGTVTPFHLASFTTDGVIQDSGLGSDGVPVLTSLPSATGVNPLDLLYLSQNGIGKKVTAATLLGTLVFINVKQYGATGDGVTDDTAAIQAAFNAVFVQSVGGTPPPTQNLGILFFPPGTYNVSSPIQINGMVGGMVQGSGRFTTVIEDTTGNGCFITNGMAYSWFSDMRLSSNFTSGELFDLDWVSSSGFLATQSNTFANMQFQGGRDQVRVGHSGAQCSENTFLNCFWQSPSRDGLRVESFNSLAQNVYGGNFQGCGHDAINVVSGSVPIVSGTGFQGSINFDIEIQGSSNDTYCISGCRSESDNFMTAPRGQVAVIGCEHTNSPHDANISIANPAVVTADPGDAFNFSADDKIFFETSGTLPSPIVAGQDYYVLGTGLTSTSFEFSATQGGAAIITTGPPGSGNQVTKRGTFAQIHFHSCELISSISRNGALQCDGSGNFDIQSCEFGRTDWVLAPSHGRIQNSRVGGLSDSGTGSKIWDWSFSTDGGSPTATPTFFDPRDDWVNIQQSDNVLTNTTSSQPIFANSQSGSGAFNLPVGAYTFDAMIYITDMSATSGNGQINIKGGGTASVSNMVWQFSGIDTSTPTSAATWSSGIVSGTTSASDIVPPTTGTALALVLKGSFQVTVAGTVTPSIALTTAAAADVRTGSFIRFSAVNYKTTGFGFQPNPDL